MEPLECLRYTEWLSPQGMAISAMEPYINMSNYPDHNEVLAGLSKIPNRRIIKAEALAKEAGQVKSVNMVMVGAASSFLPVKAASLENAISAMFGEKQLLR
jgi:indolepyruvate ferredoxin oxidoreductase beta subunit